MRTLTLFVLFTAVAAAQTSSIIPAAPATNQHPWYVKAEHGQWMICVKSYTDTVDEKTAKAFAEALAQEIRSTYKVPAYLFERGSVEAAAERARHAADLAKKRQQRAEEKAGFEAVMQQAKAEAAAKGMEFMDSNAKITAPRVEIPTQWAVLVGGWPDMETARREMEKIKTWQPPADKKLMDTQFIVRTKDGQQSGEMVHVNPFTAGMVVPNPMAPKTVDAESERETKFVNQLNAEEPYSVLKIQKKWTIAVKQFSPPMVVKGNEERSMISRLFNPQPNVMEATAIQARAMAETLRKLEGPTAKHPNGMHAFETYVLHTRYGSLVCVGQFDGPDDPLLLKEQERLGKLKFDVQVENGAKLKLDNEANKRLFDHLYAMKVRD